MGFSSRLSKFYFLCFISSVLFTISLFSSYRYGISKKIALKRSKKSGLHSLINYSGPQSTSDRKSAFYGMIYKDLYGLPTSTWGRSFSKETSELWKVLFPEYTSPVGFSFLNKQEAWLKYFPKLTKAIRKYRFNNFRKRRNRFTVTALVTRISQKALYNAGEDFVAVFYSVDAKNRKKTFGGDYYRARLITNKTISYPDGIPCEVVDNEDGSYTVKAHLAFVGTFKLELKLIMTVEGIYATMKLAKIQASSHHSFVATFDNGASSHCDMNGEKSLKKFSLCDYTNPRNREPWFCVRPVFGPCLPIRSINYSGPSPSQFMNLTFLCKFVRCQYLVKTDVNVTVTVSSSDNSTKENNIRNRLPFCKEMFKKTTRSTKIGGYIQNRKWMSLRCRNILTSIRRIKKCLQNKTLYFIGDSTIRHIFHLIIDKLWLHVEGPSNNQTWQQPKIAHDNVLQRNNITMYFRAHGPPLLTSGPPGRNAYISDLIADLPVGGKDVYVIFTIGIHLLSYEPSAYIRRLKGIKRAIILHHHRFPQTKIIVKGFSVVEYRFEWYLLRYNTILKHSFKNMKNVVFLELWDITTVWPQKDFHPLPIDINEQTLLMLSYVCD